MLTILAIWINAKYENESSAGGECILTFFLDWICAYFTAKIVGAFLGCG